MVDVYTSPGEVRRLAVQRYGSWVLSVVTRKAARAAIRKAHTQLVSDLFVAGYHAPDPHPIGAMRCCELLERHLAVDLMMQKGEKYGAMFRELETGNHFTVLGFTPCSKDELFMAGIGDEAEAAQDAGVD